MNRLPASLCSATAALLAAGCGLREPEWRTYEELGMDAPHVHGSAAEAAPATERRAAALAWTAPSGWREEGGSGMRLATFTAERDGMAASCTLITLGGTAGGLEPNIRRWIGQMQVDVPPPAELSAFLERQEKIRSEGGFEGTAVDLTEIGTSPDGASMLAAILDVGGTTLFIKMTGPASLLKAERAAFLELCRSVRPRT